MRPKRRLRRFALDAAAHVTITVRNQITAKTETLSRSLAGSPHFTREESSSACRIAMWGDWVSELGAKPLRKVRGPPLAHRLWRERD